VPENPSSLTVAAHAKLNLALAVGPAQPPKNFHPIASWFVAIDLRDTLTIAPRDAADTSRYEIRWAPDAPRPSPIDWPTDTDLAVRAHRLLEKHAGKPLPLHLILHKRIPVGGGLGGGSSDAAAMLIACNQLFTLNLARSDLRALGAQLGSDVPFFIDDALDPAQPAPRPALVTGFGETIERLPAAPPTSALLFFPPFACPTAAVYKAFDAVASDAADPAPIRVMIAKAQRTGKIDSAALFNDLSDAACAVEPDLAQTIADLAGTLGPEFPVHVSGSGSTLFTLAPSSAIEDVEHHARSARPDLAIARTRLV